MQNSTPVIADPAVMGCSAFPTATSIARLRSVDPPLLALAWQVVLEAARSTSRTILGRDDADLDDIAATAALRTLARPDLPLSPQTVLRGDVLARVAAVTARRLARDLARIRHGRRRDAFRRVDPLRREDHIALDDAVGRHAVALRTPSAEDILLAREHERHVQAIWAAAARLPRAQREAVTARLAGRRPLPPAGRQALRTALISLRNCAAPGFRKDAGSTRA